MVYGSTGSTKTSQLYHMVKKIHAKTGKKFRMIYSDGGGYAPFADSGMIESGIVDVMNFATREHALADIRRLSRGYWHRWVKNNQAYDTYESGAVEYFTSQNDVCMTRADEWPSIAGYIVEGMTSLAETLKMHVSEQDVKVGFEGSYKYEEDGELFRGIDKGHYGIIQKEIYSRHTRGFLTLPVEWVMYSAQPCLWESGKSDIKKYGPMVVGTAMTPTVPSLFDHCLCLTKERYLTNLNDPNSVTEGYVAWFTEHSDIDGLGNRTPWAAKVRVLPEAYPKLIQKYPYGFVPLGYEHGIDLLFDTLDEFRNGYKK